MYRKQMCHTETVLVIEALCEIIKCVFNLLISHASLYPNTYTERPDGKQNRRKWLNVPHFGMAFLTGHT